MPEHPDPGRVVADADVLAADLLVGGSPREALDLVRDHRSLTLVISDPLLADAREIIQALADEALASDWERRIRAEAVVVTPTLTGHAALAAAEAGNAASVLSLDDRLQSTEAGVAIRSRVTTSVKSPDAFVSLVDPSNLPGDGEGE